MRVTAHNCVVTLVCASLLLACGGKGTGHQAQAGGEAHIDSAHATPSTAGATTAVKTSGRLALDTGSNADSARRQRTADSAIKLALKFRGPHRGTSDSISYVVAIRSGLRNPGWPVHTPPLLPGSILPHERIVAFYGNPLSKKMGILGELPPPQMLAKLSQVVAQWRAADPSTPVVPALHMIVSVAQGAPGKDGMYRQRSDPDLIEKVYGWAHQQHAIMILDIQAGKSTLDSEIPRLIPFLSRPDVHLGVDPEFYMHYNREGRTPGSKIGAMDASDVNYAIRQLAAIVTKYHLPPKVLIVHRFTTNMLQHADQIKLDPRVQVVINMDGWGQPWLKFDTYRACEVAEPVEYTGFKIFFHNDTRKGDALLLPRELLALRPVPVYIQYQ
jgi:hypothetical protein